MQGIEPSDIHRLNAAIGWFGLGNRAEALAELDSISAASRNHPAVLDVRWSLLAAEGNWRDALEVARGLTASAPEMAEGWLHEAYALRRVKGGGVRKAWGVLFRAAQKFQNEPIIMFNLACYSCQLKNLDEARAWLKGAMKLGGKAEMKFMALADEDLKALWNEIGGM